MDADIPAINVIERNPYLPQPFVFTEVAVCLRDSIRRCGFRSEHLVNRIDPQAWSILLGATPAWTSKLEHLDPKRCAILNLEQLGSGSSLAGPDYVQWLAGWTVVDYHSRNIEFLRRANGPAQRVCELPIVPSPALVTTGAESRSVDVLFYGTLNERRAQVLRELESLGLSVETVAGAYGSELAPAVRRARMVVHIHFYETGLFPVARVLQPAVMGVPIVCETSVMSPMNDWSNSGIVFAHYDQLVSTCRHLLESPTRLHQHACQVQAFHKGLDFAAPFQHLMSILQPEPGCRTGALDEGLHAGDALPSLSDRQIEELLLLEGAQLPPADDAGPPLALVQREPGQGLLGKWIAWLLVAFMLLGSLKYWLDWHV